MPRSCVERGARFWDKAARQAVRVERLVD